MDNSAPLVIVWCITYNQQNYIKDALEGFVMQKTNFPFEVVVHDDASTDGTTDIVLDYASRYPQIITPFIENENQWKQGGLRCIIQLMCKNHIRSKYIAFCEGDDFWTDPQKLQMQVDFLEKHPEYSLCFHSAKKKNEANANAWINCENIEDRDYSPTEIFVNWTIPTASVVCKREGLDFYSKISNPERIQNYDIFVFLSCAMIGKLHGMHQQMSVYRIQSLGLTYDEKAVIKTKLRNPEHFECLKENFPIVAVRPINTTISKTYFERALIQQSFKLKIRDYWMSCVYDYKRFLSLFFVTLLKKIIFCFK